MLFKLKQTGRFVIATGGVIKSPKLPADNLELLEDIDSLQNDKTEVKIRYTVFVLIKKFYSL